MMPTSFALQVSISYKMTLYYFFGSACKHTHAPSSTHVHTHTRTRPHTHIHTPVLLLQKQVKELEKKQANAMRINLAQARLGEKASLERVLSHAHTHTHTHTHTSQPSTPPQHSHDRVSLLQHNAPTHTSLPHRSDHASVHTCACTGAQETYLAQATPTIMHTHPRMHAYADGATTSLP